MRTDDGPAPPPPTPGRPERALPNARGANLGETTWLDVVGREARPRNGRWEYVDRPPRRSTARAAALAWRALHVSPEADERILGHATDPCQRIDIGRSARDLLMRQDDQPVAGTYAPLALDESGCASRRYEPASA